MEKVIIAFSTIIVMMVFGIICYSIYEHVDYGTRQGIIVDKKYNSAYTYTTYDTSRIGNTTIQIPRQQYVPERYQIKIQKTENSKTKSIWIEVTAEEYSTLKIGDSYGGYEEK